MDKTKVLVVENDLVTGLSIKMSLEKLGYDSLIVVDNPTAAKNEIKHNTPDIVLIDIGLQKNSDGIELARFIKEKHNIPFIYLTGHSEDDILTQAKKTEPYGYIVKPFEPKSLHTMIQTSLYRFDEEQKRQGVILDLQAKNESLERLAYSKKSDDNSIVKFGDGYSHNMSLGETYYKGEILKLTGKENDIIRLLIANIGTTVTFQQAEEYVWAEKGGNKNGVRTIVYRLRLKLPTDVIKNAAGIGYYIQAD